MPVASRAIVSFSLQRVQGVGAALVLLRVVGLHPAEPPAPLGHRLHAELVQEELGELHPHRVELLRVHLDRLLEAPPPPLAVGLGRLETLGHVMEDRVAVGVDRRAGGLAIVSPAVLVVGQDASSRSGIAAATTRRSRGCSAACRPGRADSRPPRRGSRPSGPSGIAWTISCRARTRSRSTALTTRPPPRWLPR